VHDSASHSFHHRLALRHLACFAHRSALSKANNCCVLQIQTRGNDAVEITSTDLTGLDRSLSYTKGAQGHNLWREDRLRAIGVEWMIVQKRNHSEPREMIERNSTACTAGAHNFRVVDLAIACTRKRFLLGTLL
jgi:hypothetical protein